MENLKEPSDADVSDNATRNDDRVLPKARRQLRSAREHASGERIDEIQQQLSELLIADAE